MTEKRFNRTACCDLGGGGGGEVLRLRYERFEGGKKVSKSFVRKT